MWFGDYGALRFIFSPVARIEMSLFSFSFFSRSFFWKRRGIGVSRPIAWRLARGPRPHRVRLHWSVWPQKACTTSIDCYLGSQNSLVLTLGIDFQIFVTCMTAMFVMLFCQIGLTLLEFIFEFNLKNWVVSCKMTLNQPYLTKSCDNMWK